MIFLRRKSVLCCVSWSLAGLLFAVLNCQPVRATDQFAPTHIRQKGAEWQLVGDYLGGWAIFVAGADGKTRNDIAIRDTMSKAHFDKYVGWTTAGPIWDGLAFHYFLPIDGKAHFCVRTWWDHRILLNLETAQHVSDKAIQKTLEAFEQKQVLDTLKDGVPVLARKTAPPTVQEWNRTFRKTLAAVHVAGRMQAKEAVPLVKQLEPIIFDHSGTFRIPEKTDFKDGEVNPPDHRVMGSRRIVQLSLRRLGEKPAELPVITFQAWEDGAPGKEVEPRRWDKPRSERVPLLTRKMSPREVLDTLGPPDYVEHGHDLWRQGPWETAWRYDMDDKEPYTLLVIWDKRKVSAVERITPPLWHGNALVQEDFSPAAFSADGSLVRAKVLYTNAFRGKVRRLKLGQGD